MAILGGKSFSVIVVLLALFFISRQASAAPTMYCLPPAGGVPGTMGAPDWWTSPAPLDDPRWRGAASFDHTGDYARFRIVIDTIAGKKYLVASWEVRADPDATANDLFYVGFFNDTGVASTSTGNVFRIKRVVGTAVSNGMFPGNLQGKSFYWNGGAPTPAWNAVGAIPDFPSWIQNDARVDVDCAGAVCDAWAIRLRIPIDAAGSFDDPNSGPGLNVGTKFRFYYELKANTTSVTDPLQASYQMPEGLADVADENAIPTPFFPATSTWQQVGLDTTDPSCTKGIDLASDGIDVSKIPPAAGDDPHQISLTRQNHFNARPWNHTGGDLGGAAIQAGFRLADWGTVLFDSPSWRAIPGCSAATGTGTVLNNTQFDLTCDWTVGMPDACLYDTTPRPAGCSGITPTRNEHQCVLVDLTTAGGTGGSLYFSTASAYRNHDFVPASEFKRVSRVDIGGLAAAATPHRDVYLYIKTRNMPSEVKEGGQGGDGCSSIDPALAKRLSRLDLKSCVVGKAQAEVIKRMLASGELSIGDVEKIMPTYMVYAWYDTGKVITSGGNTFKRLAAMPSFGYFVSHDGALTGWSHGLEGAGLTKIGRDFYKVGVPNNGSVNVVTTLAANETNPPNPILPGSHLPWWLWLLLLGIVFIVAIMRKRRGSHP
jgi:hypothetical protein